MAAGGYLWMRAMGPTLNADLSASVVAIARSNSPLAAAIQRWSRSGCKQIPQRDLQQQSDREVQRGRRAREQLDLGGRLSAICQLRWL
jgi:hypothetical protein